MHQESVVLDFFMNAPETMLAFCFGGHISLILPWADCPQKVWAGPLPSQSLYSRRSRPTINKYAHKIIRDWDKGQVANVVEGDGHEEAAGGVWEGSGGNVKTKA